MTFLSCYWPLFSKRPRALKASIRTCAEEKRSRRRCNIFSRRSPGSRRVTSHVNATLFRLNASGSSCHFSWLDHFYNEIWNGVWLCEANLLLAKWLSKSLKVRLFLMQGNLPAATFTQQLLWADSDGETEGTIKKTLPVKNKKDFLTCGSFRVSLRQG